MISIRSEVTALRRGESAASRSSSSCTDPEREGRKTDTDALRPRVLRARRVVVAAGAIGSTYLLLRNRASLGIATPALGTRFCGNGDLLGFILKSERDGAPFPLEGSKGPVISSYIRWPDNVDTNSPEDFGMYLEDAGFPAFMQWLVEATQLSATAASHRDLHLRPHQGTLHRSAQGAPLGRALAAARRGCAVADRRCRCWRWAATSPTVGCT